MATERLVKGFDSIVETDPIEAFLQQQEAEKATAATKQASGRRPGNTGHLNEVRPGVWRLKVYRGRNALGKKQYKTKTVKGTREEAARALTELQLEYGSNSPVSPSEMTLGLILVLWQGAHQDIWQPATKSNHQSIVRRLEPLSHIKVDQAKPKVFADFYAELRHEGLAAGTVTRIHSAARSAGNWAVEQGHIRANPLASVRSPGSGRSKPKMPTAPEVGQLIKAARASDAQFASVIEFAVISGARRGEIVGLGWEDVIERPDGDFTVRFCRCVSRGVVVEGLKAGDEKSIIVQRELIEKMRAVAKNDEWVFGMAKGHVSVGTISRKYKRLTDGQGLDVGTFHGLRHFCGSHLFNATNMSPIDIAAHLGHSRPSTTLDLYAHVVEPNQTGAAQALASVIAA